MMALVQMDEEMKNGVFGLDGRFREESLSVLLWI